MLTITIEDAILSTKLEDGIINRKVLADRIPVNVEYSLTKKGKEIIPILELMENWGERM